MSDTINTVIAFYKAKCEKKPLPPIVMTTIDIMRVGGYITGLQISLAEAADRAKTWRRETMDRREEVYKLKTQVSKLDALLLAADTETLIWQKAHEEQKSYKEKAIAQVIELKRRGHVDV